MLFSLEEPRSPPQLKSHGLSIWTCIPLVSFNPSPVPFSLASALCDDMRLPYSLKSSNDRTHAQLTIKSSLSSAAREYPISLSDLQSLRFRPSRSRNRCPRKMPLHTQACEDRSGRRSPTVVPSILSPSNRTRCSELLLGSTVGSDLHLWPLTWHTYEARLFLCSMYLVCSQLQCVLNTW